MALSCPLKVRFSVPDLASNIRATVSPLPVYTELEKEQKYRMRTRPRIEDTGLRLLNPLGRFHLKLPPVEMLNAKSLAICTYLIYLWTR